MATLPTLPPDMPPAELPTAESLAPVMTSWCPRASMLPEDFPIPNVSLPPQSYGTEFLAFATEESLRPPPFVKTADKHVDKSFAEHPNKPSGSYAYVRPPKHNVA